MNAYLIVVVDNKSEIIKTRDPSVCFELYIARSTSL